MLDWVEGAAALDPTGAGAPPPAGRVAHGPPAWLEHPTAPEELAPAADRVRALVRTLPDVEEHDHHGRPAWRIGGDGPTFAAVQDATRLWVEASPGEVRERTTTSPDVYERHWGLTIRLDRADPHEVRRLLRTAHRLAAVAAADALTWTDVVLLAGHLDDARLEEVGGSTAAALCRPSTGRTFAALADGGTGTLRLRTTAETAAALTLADPGTFRPDPDPHADDDDQEDLLVDLDTVGRHRLGALLRHAWEQAGR